MKKAPKLFAEGHKTLFISSVALSIAPTVLLVLQLYVASVLAYRIFSHYQAIPLAAEQRLVDLFGTGGTNLHVSKLILIYLVLQLIRIALQLILRHSMERLGFAGRNEVRQRLYDKLSRVNPKEIDAAMRGRLVHLLGEGIEALFYYYGFFLPQIFAGILAPVAILYVIALVDPISALALAMCVPMLPLILRILFSKFRAATMGYREQLSHMMELYMESLHALGILRILGFSYRWGFRIRRRGEQLRSSTMELLKVNQLLIFVMDLLFSLGILMLATLLVLMRLDILGASAGLFILFASVELMRPMMLLGNFFYFGAIGREIKRESAALEALSELPQREQPAEAELLAIENLGFSYNADQSILNNFSCRIAKGEFVVLTGASGSGKTTLFSLISGALEADKGSIAARPFGYVRQKPYLFEGSLRENIELGLGSLERKLSDDDYEQLLKGLHLSHIATQMIKRDGEGISGGQASRIALARALVSDASWFLLDEVTSGLEAQTEALVLARIKKLARDKGVLMITHSPRAMAAADRIIHLSAGDSAAKEAPHA